MEGEKKLIEHLGKEMEKLKVVREGLSHPAWKAITTMIDAEIDDAINNIANGNKTEHMSGRLYAYRRVQNMWKYAGTQLRVCQIERGRAQKAIGDPEE